MDRGDRNNLPHRVSVVIPVYQGERHLQQVVNELAGMVDVAESPDGHPFGIVEILLVNDCGPDRSDEVIRRLSEQYDFVRPIWLSRNFGQHAATLAGMASSAGEWIVTMDEDGQHNPTSIGPMLDVAMREQVNVVYAQPTNPPPHSAFRNWTSRAAKRAVKFFSGGADARVFHSYRLVLGDVGRSVAAYSGSGVYLDIALSWVARKPGQAPVEMRSEGERRSGYSLRRLISHFWRMVISGGTRGLRVVSAAGVCFGLLGLVFAVYLVAARISSPTLVEGWTSLIVVILVATGVILFALGIIAEYIGVAVSMAMGKPLYLITSDPTDGPLGRRAIDA